MGKEPAGAVAREAQGLALLRRTIVGFLWLQVGAALVVAAGFFAFGSRREGASALLGGLIGVAPSALYGLMLLRVRPQSPLEALRGHVVGEFGKLGLTLLMFAVVFAGLREVAALPLFSAYLATLAVYWAALLLFA